MPRITDYDWQMLQESDETPGEVGTPSIYCEPGREPEPPEDWDPNPGQPDFEFNTGEEEQEDIWF